MHVIWRTLIETNSHSDEHSLRRTLTQTNSHSDEHSFRRALIQTSTHSDEQSCVGINLKQKWSFSFSLKSNIRDLLLKKNQRYSIFDCAIIATQVYTYSIFVGTYFFQDLLFICQARALTRFMLSSILNTRLSCITLYSKIVWKPNNVRSKVDVKYT